VTQAIETGNIAGIRRAVDMLQYAINIMRQTTHQLDEFMGLEVYGQLDVDYANNREYQRRASENMRLFFASIDNTMDVWHWNLRTEDYLMQLYDYHAIPCRFRTNRNLCENYFVFHKSVENVVDDANIKHCVWADDDRDSNGGTCSMGQNCDFQYE
jgi:hypothetical protein